MTLLFNLRPHFWFNARRLATLVTITTTSSFRSCGNIFYLRPLPDTQLGQKTRAWRSWFSEEATAWKIGSATSSRTKGFFSTPKRPDRVPDSPSLSVVNCIQMLLFYFTVFDSSPILFSKGHPYCCFAAKTEQILYEAGWCSGSPTLHHPTQFF